MGLTIHYSLYAPPLPVADARAVVEQLRQHARDLPFRSVGDLLELSGAACDDGRRDRADPHRWLPTQANHRVEHDGRRYDVAPTRLPALAASPGEGPDCRGRGQTGGCRRSKPGRLR